MEIVKKLEQIEQNQSLQDIKIELLNSTLLKIADVETQIENQVEDIMNVQLGSFMKFQQQNDKQAFKFQTPVQETISMTSQLQKDALYSKLDQIENQDRIKGQQLNYFGKTQFKDQDYIDSRSVDILKQQLDQIQNKNLSDFQIKKLVEIQNLILNQNYQSLGDVLSDSNYEYGLLKKNESNQKNQILDQVKTKVTYIQNLQSKIKNDKIDQQNEEQQQDQQQQNQQQNQYQVLLKQQDQTQIKQQNQFQTQINQQQYQQDQQKALNQEDQIQNQKTQQKNEIFNDQQNSQQQNLTDQNIRKQENTLKQKDFQSEKYEKLSKITIIPQNVFQNIFEKQPPIVIEYPNQDVSKMPDSSSQLKKQDQIYKFQPRYYSQQKDIDKVENFQYKLKNIQKDEPIYVKPEMIPSKPQIQHVIQAPHQQSVVSTNFDLNSPPQYTINSYFQPTNGQAEQLPSQSFTLNQDLDQINLNYMPSQADPNIELEEQFLQTGAI